MPQSRKNGVIRSGTRTTDDEQYGEASFLNFNFAAAYGIVDVNDQASKQALRGSGGGSFKIQGAVAAERTSTSNSRGSGGEAGGSGNNKRDYFSCFLTRREHIFISGIYPACVAKEKAVVEGEEGEAEVSPV